MNSPASGPPWSRAGNCWTPPHITTDGNLRAPSATFEYMLVSDTCSESGNFRTRSLVDRSLKAYAVKAAREAKQETSWLNPHEGYEASLGTFIERILDRSLSAEFLDSLDHFARRVALLGALNSLSQVTLKAMMPGVPDFYQGTEFWDLSHGRPRQSPARRFSQACRCASAGGAAGLASPRPRLAQRPRQARLNQHLSGFATKWRKFSRTAITNRWKSAVRIAITSWRLPAAAAVMP